uniref:Uncharacterized protein n=1 Tax=Physcomitrium patens TaxID=3218 RepID=A0A2K1KW52_PHYPA|nr:hypothetical protein PHYPA_004996 [Physcomitrium patens]
MESVEQLRSEEGGDEVLKKGPLIARFPRQSPVVEPVKLESEVPEVESKPARNMIQMNSPRAECVALEVYLMAAYLVGRWAWARYQERQQRPKFDGRRKSPKDDSLF